MINNNTNIYIFEDNFLHYRILRKSLNDLGYKNIFPTEEKFGDFIINTQEYINGHMSDDVFAKKTSLFQTPPGLFLIDIKLYDTENTNDYSGIQLRNGLIQNYFPITPVIFISQFNNLMEQEKKPRDGAINKFFLGQLNSHIERHLKNVLPEVIQNINSLPDNF